MTRRLIFVLFFLSCFLKICAASETELKDCEKYLLKGKKIVENLTKLPLEEYKLLSKTLNGLFILSTDISDFSKLLVHEQSTFLPYQPLKDVTKEAQRKVLFKFLGFLEISEAKGMDMVQTVFKGNTDLSSIKPSIKLITYFLHQCRKYSLQQYIEEYQVPIDSMWQKQIKDAERDYCEKAFLYHALIQTFIAVDVVPQKTLAVRLQETILSLYKKENQK